MKGVFNCASSCRELAYQYRFHNIMERENLQARFLPVSGLVGGRGWAHWNSRDETRRSVPVLSFSEVAKWEKSSSNADRTFPWSNGVEFGISQVPGVRSFN